ncbi:sensor histidine kinase [Roseiconus lacunae]|uniref:histidine kinase n=1 Tax=Roseiconus lacunae TaxID=2605694 RepID=A0ABT7PHH2_9BACT|nr:HAMP domain-containing sensor histidine kinase [Roseiconus lacunae]MCD0458808.1 HAMP domain-containing histidine kinase [Roseiconus lacunae]MDM4015788.1 HAMP domain-containing sensor histidine kinase [Roseiconus lacunae]WRQ52393.1 HAMP domain-containing sensor histidine kinase [Stieleria sp. HD01]
MLERRSLRAPVVLGVVLIVLVVVLGAIWTTSSFFTASRGGLFLILFIIGTVLLISILAGVIVYVTLTVKAFRLNQRQSNFIDSVTHELKSPIASLKLYLQTMSRHTVDENQQRDFHRIMLDDVERLDALINHLLDAARIDRGNQSDAPEVFRLDELLAQCAQAACMRYRLSPDVVQLECEPTSIRSPCVQVEILFRNLIDNAIKYGGSPPQVTASIRPSTEKSKSDQVVVSIADNGAGIPYDMRRKIFGRFVRLGSELERSTPGTGLGLYLVRTISKSLGATIRIRGRKDVDGSPGTVFEVTMKHVVPTSIEPVRQ